MIGIALAGVLVMVLAIRFANNYVSNVIVVVALGASVYIASCGWFIRKWLHQEMGSLR